MCILLVADERTTLLAANFSLEAAGFDVLTACHGQQAIDHIEQRPDHFTCLVTDFQMLNGVTGANVIEHMRLGYPVIPKVLASAVTPVVSEQWRLRHCVSLLEKPYDMHELVALVRGLLGGSERAQSRGQ